MVNLEEIHPTHKCNMCRDTHTFVICNKYCRLNCDKCIISEIVDTYIMKYIVEDRRDVLLDTNYTSTQQEYNGTE